MYLSRNHCNVVFADKDTEVRHALEHLLPVMPRLGLAFSKLDVLPAAGSSVRLDKLAFEQLGCKVFAHPHVTIMKCPVGDVTYCENVVSRRVAKGVDVVQKFQELPDAHCALHLLRY